MVYASQYQEAADVWMNRRTKDQGFDIVSYQLLCQALELYLKSFIWLKDRIPENQFILEYGHNIPKLWKHSKSRGIARYAAVTPYGIGRFIWSALTTNADVLPT